MTFSIIARCPETDRLGVAVASCVLAVGVRAPLAVAGVGVVAAQADSWLHWRQSILDLLGRGLSAEEVITMMATLDGTTGAQFAALGSTGSAAVFTGPGASGYAGHAISADGSASAQANTMESAEVWQAMIGAYTSSGSSFPRRLVEALSAAEHVGADYRGKQSASLMVVSGERGFVPTGDAHDPTVDLRVDDSRSPVQDLHRLLDVHDAHRHLIEASMTADPAESFEATKRAARLCPEDPLIAPVVGIRAALQGEREEAATLLARAAQSNPSTWSWARRELEAATAKSHENARVLREVIEAHDRS
jgi:uncharacterized Ntn-hydrolase superfamily protein